MAETPPDRTRVPLLTLITQQSLDEDYQHVADKRAASGSSGPNGGGRVGRRARWVATAVVAAFGLLVMTAGVQTSESAGINDASRESLLRQIEQRKEGAADLQRRIVRLRELNVGLRESSERAATRERSARNRVERLRTITGFGVVSGPGVEITVDDGPNEAVRDEDLALLVNGLWEAGAEAIAINGKRLTARSALRNSGAAINLNGPPPLSPPYVVSAIGDDRTLQADLLNTTTGLQFNTVADAFGFPVTRKNVDSMTLPAAAPRLLRLRSAVAGTAEENRKPPVKETAP